jgi:hypothetical protein
VSDAVTEPAIACDEVAQPASESTGERFSDSDFANGAAVDATVSVALSASDRLRAAAAETEMVSVGATSSANASRIVAVDA